MAQINQAVETEKEQNRKRGRKASLVYKDSLIYVLVDIAMLTISKKLDLSSL